MMQFFFLVVSTYKVRVVVFESGTCINLILPNVIVFIYMHANSFLISFPRLVKCKLLTAYFK